MVKPRNLNLAVLRNDPNEIYEGTCLSTDTKPTNWPDNSILFELDTGTRYYSNSGTWYPVGGGDDGGSSGGGGVFLVGSHPTIESALDKTWNEINTAMGEGKNVYFVEVVGDYTNYYAINSAYYAADAFSVEGGNDVWVSQTADGYPVIP